MPSNTGTVYIGSSKKASNKVSGRNFFPPQKGPSTLDELERRAKMIIFEAESSRPLFSKYKNKITICLNRVTITHGNMFDTEEYPMAIENITGARVFRHLMSASLDIDTFGVMKPAPLKHMRVNQARLARRYILALIECKKSNVDLSGIGLEEIRERLKNLGMVRYTSYEKKYHEL